MATKLDRIDVNILVELQRNGRMTNADVAEAVGLSPSPCLLRVKRLQKAGFISGYNAKINLRKLGKSISVFLEITLSQHRMENFTRFESGLQRVPEVVECHLMSGGIDYLIKIVARNLTHLQQTIEGMLEANLGIAKYVSYIVVKSPIENPTYPLKLLLDDSDDND